MGRADEEEEDDRDYVPTACANVRGLFGNRFTGCLSKTFLVHVGTVETGHSIAPQFVVTPKSVRWIQIRQVNLNDTQPMRILGWYENVRRTVQHAGAGRLDRFNRAGA